jgi:hypothetical protein
MTVNHSWLFFSSILLNLDSITIPAVSRVGHLRRGVSCPLLSTCPIGGVLWPLWGVLQSSRIVGHPPGRRRLLGYLAKIPGLEAHAMKLTPADRGIGQHHEGECRKKIAIGDDHEQGETVHLPPPLPASSRRTACAFSASVRGNAMMPTTAAAKAESALSAAHFTALASGICCFSVESAGVFESCRAHFSGLPVLAGERSAER